METEHSYSQRPSTGPYPGINESRTQSRGSIARKAKRFVSSIQRSENTGADPAPYSMSTMYLSLEFKRLRNKADYFPPTGAELKNLRSTSIPP
jgi:hypothetical protein